MSRPPRVRDDVRTDVRPAPEAGPRRRRRRFSIWAATVALLLGLLFTAVTVLTVAVWLTDPDSAESGPVVDLGFFALGGILVGVGVASQVRAPERNVAGLQQSVLALVILAVAGLLGARIEPFVGAVVLLVAMVPLVVLHPARDRLRAAGRGVSRPLAALAVAALGPALVFAAGMLDRARTAGPSCFLGQCVRGDRFAEMAAVAVAVAAVALVAALKTEGWTVPARSAGAAALLVGAASLVFPQEIGALSSAWALVAAVWGATVLVVASVEARRDHAVPRGVRVALNVKGR